VSEQRLLSKADLARLLSVSCRTISRMNAKGETPKAIRLGRLLRWPQNEIDEWIAAGCPNRSDWESRNTFNHKSVVSAGRSQRE